MTRTTLLPAVAVSQRPELATTSVVWLRGEHDVSTVHRVANMLARVIDRTDGDVVVDLSGVAFMGAATIAVLARGRDILALSSRSLVLRAPSARARRVLDICGLATLIDPPAGDAAA